MLQLLYKNAQYGTFQRDKFLFYQTRANHRLDILKEEKYCQVLIFVLEINTRLKCKLHSTYVSLHLGRVDFADCFQYSIFCLFLQSHFIQYISCGNRSTRYKFMKFLPEKIKNDNFL